MRRKLTDEEKAYVVRRLAAYDKPAAIAQGLKDIFGVTATPQSIEHYDPQRPAGHDLAPHWREVFWAARKAYIAETAGIGHMDKPVRLRLRERMAIAAWEEGTYKLANELLNDLAREAGDVFTGRNKVAHFGFGGIQPTAIVTVTGPADYPPARARADDDDEPRD
jgi:hypothetical protein